MPYIQRSDAPQLTSDFVDALARAVGLTIPPEDRAPLAQSLTDQLGSVGLLDRLDLSAVNPAAEFDPRWPDEVAGEPGRGHESGVA